jgi:hypothetical protein
MRKIKNSFIAVTLMLFLSVTVNLSAQDLRFGLYADPAVSWFSSNTKEVANDGARSGFSFGFTFNRYFAENYSFSTGLSLQNVGGRLTATDTVLMQFNNISAEVLPGKPVIYRLQYLSVPLGLKLESNQIGYIKIFSDLGLDTKFLVGGKADIPSAQIEKEVALRELNRLNIGWHLTAGIEYSLGGTTELLFGIGFENSFIDITKDLKDQPDDRIKNNLIKFRLGLNF